MEASGTNRGQIAAHRHRVTVVGTGYVGLVTGACLAELGHTVACNDVSAARVDALRRGEVPFHEPGLADIVKRTQASGRLRASTDLKECLSSATVAIVAVGTPSKPDGSADLTFVHQVATDVAKHAGQGLVLVLRSTVPPGTGDAVQARLKELGRPDITVVNAPEFLAEGTAVKDFQQPDRLVFGGPKAAAAQVASLWDGVRPDAKRHLVDRPTAELCKYAANTFLAARVSLINEVANLCDAVGADVRAVSEIVGQDTRIGAKFLRPGIGYGGSCFPKDVQAITHLGRAVGVAMPVAEATETTNNVQWKKVEAKVLRALEGSPKGKVVAILGIAFKPDTDDTRYAPGLNLARALAEAGAKVRMHDPLAKLPQQLQALVQQSPSPSAAVAGAHLVVQATEWPQYRALDWKSLAVVVKQAHLIDARNTLPWPDMAAAGWTVEGVGARSEVLA